MIGLSKRMIDILQYRRVPRRLPAFVKPIDFNRWNDIKNKKIPQAIAEKIKETTSSFTILVGPHVSAVPSETLKLSEIIDAIAVSEYDYTT